MKKKSSRISAIPIMLLAFLCSLHWHGGNASTLCSRMDLDSKHSQGIFGCYNLVALAGGIIGGFRDSRDAHACVVLTPDSLFSQYFNDSLYQKSKAVLSGMKERDGWRTALITFGDSAAPEQLVASWRNDTLWIGMVGVIADAQSAMYVKCCR